jgi:hypothetical protein
MSFRLPVIVGAVFSLLLILATTGRAQSVPSPYEFIDERQKYGVYVGHVPGNRGQLELGPGGGLMIGARFGYHLSGPLGLEVNGFLLPTDRLVRVPDDESGIEDRGSADALVGAIDGRIRFSITGNRTWNGLAPFLTAGGGVAMNLQGRSDIEAEIPESVRFSFGPSFLGGLSAGTRWLPTDRITVRVEAGVNYWKLGTPDAFIEAGESGIGQPVPDQEWTPVSAFTLGLSYRR